MKVQVYATLRPIVGGKQMPLIPDVGETVRAYLTRVTEAYPQLARLVWTEDGGLTDYLKVFINGRDARVLEGADTVFPAGAEVDIFPPVAGG